MASGVPIQERCARCRTFLTAGSVSPRSGAYCRACFGPNDRGPVSPQDLEAVCLRALESCSERAIGLSASELFGFATTQYGVISVRALDLALRALVTDQRVERVNERWRLCDSPTLAPSLTSQSATAQTALEQACLHAISNHQFGLSILDLFHTLEASGAREVRLGEVDFALCSLVAKGAIEQAGTQWRLRRAQKVDPLDPVNLGQWILAQRSEHQLTLAQLARVVGVSQTAVQSWERGDSVPDSEEAADLLQAFDFEIPDGHSLAALADAIRQSAVNVKPACADGASAATGSFDRDFDRVAIGKWIRDRRSELRLTQAELGRIVKAHQSRVSCWERGEGLPDEVEAGDLLTTFVGGVTGDALSALAEEARQPTINNTGDAVGSGVRREPAESSDLQFRLGPSGDASRGSCPPTNSIPAAAPPPQQGDSPAAQGDWVRWLRSALGMRQADMGLLMGHKDGGKLSVLERGKHAPRELTPRLGTALKRLWATLPAERKAGTSLPRWVERLCESSPWSDQQKLALGHENLPKRLGHDAGPVARSGSSLPIPPAGNTPAAQGAWVRWLRSELGLRQEDMARQLGYKHATTLSVIERGKHSVSRDVTPSLARGLKSLWLSLPAEKRRQPGLPSWVEEAIGGSGHFGVRADASGDPKAAALVAGSVLSSAGAPSNVRAGGSESPAHPHTLVDLIVTLGASVAHADGRVDRTEEEEIRRFVVTHPGLAAHEAGRIDEMLARIRSRPPGDVMRCAAELRSRLDQGARSRILEYLFTVAVADGTFHRKEESLLFDLHRGLGVDGEHFKLLMRMCKAHPVSGAAPSPVVSGSTKGTQVAQLRESPAPFIRSTSSHATRGHASGNGQPDVSSKPSGTPQPGSETEVDLILRLLSGPSS